MPTELTHTPAPWKADGGDTGTWWAVTTERSGEVIADLSDSSFDTDEDRENAHRIVACVNACAGIDDPAAALAELRAAYAEYYRLDGAPVAHNRLMSALYAVTRTTA